jgi:hypothetical protein
MISPNNNAFRRSAKDMSDPLKKTWKLLADGCASTLLVAVNAAYRIGEPFAWANLYRIPLAAYDKTVLEGEAPEKGGIRTDASVMVERQGAERRRSVRPQDRPREGLLSWTDCRCSMLQKP